MGGGRARFGFHASRLNGARCHSPMAPHRLRVGEVSGDPVKGRKLLALMATFGPLRQKPCASTNVRFWGNADVDGHRALEDDDAIDPVMRTRFHHVRSFRKNSRTSATIACGCSQKAK